MIRLLVVASKTLHITEPVDCDDETGEITSKHSTQTVSVDINKSFNADYIVSIEPDDKRSEHCWLQLAGDYPAILIHHTMDYVFDIIRIEQKDLYND